MNEVLFLALGIPILLVGGTIFEYCRRFQKEQRQLRLLRDRFGAWGGDGSMLARAEEYWRSGESAARPGRFLLDDITWDDLELDAVYRALDHCQSVMGKVVLYETLRTLHTDGSAGEERAALRQALDEESALQLQARLSRLGDRPGSGNFQDMQLLCRGGEIFATPYRVPILLFAPLPLIFLILTPLAPAEGVLLFLIAIIFNMIGSMILKGKIPTFRAGRSLGVFVNTAEKLLPAVRGLDPAMGERLDAALQGMRPFRLPLNLLAIDATTDEMGFNIGNFIGLGLLAYLRLEHLIHKKQADIQQLVETLGQIDLACAEVSFRQGLPFLCEPEYSQVPGVETVSLYHPMLDNPVPNDAELARNVLITGSNASGKSTFMRAVGLNCVLAQTFGFCTARQFRMRLGGVASSMNNADDLHSGNSYFVNEAQALRRLIRLAEQEYCHLFIDEIFRGTNTLERVAASAAMLRLLYEQTDSMCITATHDMELTDILRREYQMLHFSEESREGKIYFDYKLRTGPSRTKNALLLLRDFGFPAEMVDQAEELTDAFSRTNRWPQFDPAGTPGEDSCNAAGLLLQ